ncbi:hypothetical protein HDA40_005549 [Hamadaea flava]|uniref:Uncharacterized protein n=1 Tax=Hamadaea flava TaxID=1742688 RepID=A0ABV8LT63_9ACTN|nr:hypothetical protein [Hamadaea flava]MCP2327042.1 hypothetical protein [Hamadaea flava]
MAELHTTKRVRELAAVLQEAVSEQGGDLPGGDYVERLVAERVTIIGRQMGITPRTVMTNYVTPELVREWGTGLAAQMRDAELTAHDTTPVTVEQRDGLLVLAAFGVCGMLAARNADRREHIDPRIVAKDAADSTVQVAVPMYEAKRQPVQIGGLTVVVARKVIGMTLEALREGWWECTCEQPHRSDGGCVLQDRLQHDLATLGGWVNRGEAV